MGEDKNKPFRLLEIVHILNCVMIALEQIYVLFHQVVHSRFMHLIACMLNTIFEIFKSII